MRARAAAVVTIALAAIVFLRAVPEWIDSTVRSPDATAAAALGFSWAVVAAVLLAVGTAAVIAYGVAAGIVLWRGERAHAAVVGTALALVGFGLTDALAALRAADPAWTVPVLAVGNAANALALAVLLTFPTGRFVPRWGAPLLVAWTGYLCAMLAVPSLRWEALDGIAILAELAVFAIAVGAQCYRYARRSTTADRRRTKWILWAFLVMFPAAVVRDVPPLIFPTVTQAGTVDRFAFDVIRVLYWDVAAAVVALAIALSVIRNHLLDVDIVIGHTIVVTTLTALVAGIFTGVSAITNWVILAVTGQHSEVANIIVAVLVAVAIAPLRRVVRQRVDRVLTARAA